MFPFSIANAMKATGNGEDERQYAFGRQKFVQRHEQRALKWLATGENP